MCLEARHPVTITTKSDRVLRDLDLLSETGGAQPGRGGDFGDQPRSEAVGPARTARLPPRPSGWRRWASWSRPGVPAHVSVAPVIPCITDEFIEGILERAGALGVRSASWIMLRLPHEVAPLFREWLATHFPERGDKVMGIVRSVRDGKRQRSRTSSAG